MQVAVGGTFDPIHDGHRDLLRRAEDGEILSSTRIVQGEIDEHGNLTPRAEGRVVDRA